MYFELGDVLVVTVCLGYGAQDRKQVQEKVGIVALLAPIQCGEFTELLYIHGVIKLRALARLGPGKNA